MPTLKKPPLKKRRKQIVLEAPKMPEQLRKEGRSLTTRTIAGFVMGALAVACIVLGPTALSFLALVIVLLGLREFLDMASRKGSVPTPYPANVAATVLILSAPYVTENTSSQLLMALILVIYMVLLWQAHERNNSFVDAGTTVLGVLYVAFGFMHILHLRKMDVPEVGYTLMGHAVSAGFVWTWLLAWATSMSDVGCYLSGKLFGKHKLFPSVSPNKTWEGAIGGLLFAVLLGSAWGHAFGVQPWQYLLFCFVVAIAGQLGDLWESVLKRDAGIKDAGSFIPGHGGVLDRFDSFLVSVPVAYFLVKFIILRGLV